MAGVAVDWDLALFVAAGAGLVGGGVGFLLALVPYYLTVWRRSEWTTGNLVVLLLSAKAALTDHHTGRWVWKWMDGTMGGLMDPPADVTTNRALQLAIVMAAFFLIVRAARARAAYVAALLTMMAAAVVYAGAVTW